MPRPSGLSSLLMPRPHVTFPAASKGLPHPHHVSTHLLGSYNGPRALLTTLHRRSCFIRTEALWDREGSDTRDLGPAGETEALGGPGACDAGDCCTLHTVSSFSPALQDFGGQGWGLYTSLGSPRQRLAWIPAHGRERKVSVYVMRIHVGLEARDANQTPPAPSHHTIPPPGRDPEPPCRF